MMANPEQETGSDDGNPGFPHVGAQTMPAPPMEEHAQIERLNRKQFATQCVAVLVIGMVLHWCFGAFFSGLVAKLVGLRRTSWLPECLTCGALIFLPLVPIVWRYFRRITPTPRS